MSENDSAESPTPESILNSPKPPNCAPKLSQGDDKLLLRVLEDAKLGLDAYLKKHPRQKLLLDNCAPSTRQKVEEKLADFERQKESRVEASIEDRRYLVQIAIHLLDAFVPKNTPSSLVDIFWGSLLEILPPPKNCRQIGLRSMISYADLYLKIITEIRNGVSANSSPKKPQYAIPEALVSAFQHLVMVFCIFSQNTENNASLQEAENTHHRRCEQLLLEGKNQLILMHAGDMSMAKTCKGIDSEGLAALILTRLVIIKENGKPESNIITTYKNYMSKIELEVLESPTVRVYDDIQDLVEELTIIEAITKQQLTALESSLTLCTATAKSTHAFSLQVLQKGLRHVNKQLNHVTELLQLAEHKKNLLSQAIDVRKEANNVAILIFTAITVIFLPLSFITSYLTISDAQFDLLGSSYSNNGSDPGPCVATSKVQTEAEEGLE